MLLFIRSDSAVYEGGMQLLEAVVAISVAVLAAVCLLLVHSLKAQRRRTRRHERRLLHDAEALQHWQALQKLAAPNEV